MVKKTFCFKQLSVRTSLFIFAIFSHLAITSNAQWVSSNNGLYGGNIKALAVSGTNFFAATDGGGVFLSSDAGASWSAINSGLSSLFVNCLTVSGSTVFAGTNNGVFISSNSGTSWTSALPSVSTASLLVNGSSVFVGTNSGVYHSSNGGSSWSLVNTGLPSNAYVTSLAISGSAVFAGVYGNGIYISTNNGTSWAAVNTGLSITSGTSVQALAVSNGTIFTGFNGAGIFTSANNGTSWAASNSGLSGLYIYCFATMGNTLFAGTNSGVYLSSNNGASWSPANTGYDRTIQALAASSNTLVAGLTSGIIISGNSGTTWSSANIGITAYQIITMASKGNTVLAGTNDGSAFLSQDNGASWVSTSALSGYALICAAVSSSAFFVGTNGGGVLSSVDDGASWSYLSSGLASSPYVQSLAISGNSLVAGLLGSGGVYVSTNNGSTWAAVNTGLPITSSTSINSVAINGSVIIVAFGNGAGVYLSANNGASWNVINSSSGLTSQNVSSIVVSGSNIFLASTAGVFRSSDNGTTWTGVNNGLSSDYSNVSSLAVSGSTLFASANNKVFISQNNGTSWMEASTGLPGNTNVRLYAGTSKLFGGTYGQGVYARSLSDFTTTITSFAPTSGPIGTTVTITGKGFSTTPANNIVYFGATKATATAATETSLTATVPIGATYQPITVTTNGLTVYSSNPFLVTFSGGGTIDANSFSSKIDITSATNADIYHAISGDVDNDGKVDIVTANYNSNTVSVFRNTSSLSSISYASKVDFSTGLNPSFVALADVDGNGMVDIIVTNNTSNTVSIFRNLTTTGVISFAAKQDFATGNGPNSIAVGDLNRDGKPDLIIGNVYTNTISIFANNSTLGSINMTTKNDLSIGSSVSVNFVAIGDLDIDGMGDIVVGTSSTVSVFRNTSPSGGMITLAAGIDLVTGISTSAIAVGDTDGDNKLDLAIATATSGVSNVSVFKNSSTVGSISYEAKIDYTPGNYPSSIALGDLDGDGKVDLAVTNNDGNLGTTVSVFKNLSSSASISFSSKIDFSTGTGPLSISIGDLDGDGKPDMLTANYTSNSISVLRNLIGIPTISSFTPTSAPVGSPVTISGTNFDTTPANNVVTFNGTTATVTGSTTTSITTTVPTGATTGKITVTVRGLNTTSTTDFTVIPTPTITSVNPSSGPVGSTVAVFGTNFSTTASNLVKVNGVLGDNITASSATGLNFRVPSSATSGKITVEVNGVVATSPTNFVVTPPGSQTVLSFFPFSGTPGTLVAISGTNFSIIPANNIVKFNGILATLVGTPTPTSITVSVPIGATTGAISVEIAGNVATSVATFAVTTGDATAPLITSFSPTDNATSVTTNSNLSFAFGEIVQKGAGNILVKEGGVLKQTISVTDAGVTISGATVTIDPADFTPSTAVNVEMAAGVFKDLSNNNFAGIADATTWNFTVAQLVSPSIASFNPISGLVGATVTVTGTNFDATAANNIVKFNGTTATVTTSTTTSITTTVPTGATTGKITVTVGGQTATSATDFTVTTATLPTIASFNPTSGVIGAAITITGTNFSTTASNNIVKFNGTVATITGTPTATSIATLVPTGATTGKITIEVAGQVGTSSTDFTVTTATSPTIASFNPTMGLVGTPVTITGTNFSATASSNIVKFNGTTATVTASSVTSITTSVPTGAATGKIAVTVGGQTATSTTDFTVTTATSPTIASFNPTSGLVGTAVTITGTNFDATAANNTVRFNGTTAIVTATTTTGITTTVPTGSTTGKITVTVGGQTATSATDFTVTTDSSPVIASQIFPTSFTKGSGLTISITVDDVSKVSAVNFRSGGISEALATFRSSPLSASGNKFEKVLAANELTDPLGLVYYFEVLDKSTPATAITSTTAKAFVNYGASSIDQALPGLSFGTQVSNYQIIAFPLTITNNSVTSVFATLGTYDKTKWRLFDYANGDNREYSAFTTIEPGKGYWLIVKDNVTINPGAAQVVQADDANPFLINLSSGWNLIGNPYNFNLLWSDVLAANSAAAGIAGVSQTMTTLSGSTLSNAATVLPKYRGAFVKSASAISLKIPVKYNSSAGRVASELEESVNLDQPNWEVKLTLFQDGLRNEMAGIGMNTGASLTGKDQFDKERVPLPFDITELSSIHPEIASAFNKDVVPTQENFTWTFDVKHAAQSSNASLAWAKDNFRSSNKQLVLFDPAALQVVDMSASSSYSITALTNQLQFFYGDKDYIQKALDKELPLLGSPYPNPAKEEVTIAFRVPEIYDQRQVQIKIYSALGVEVNTLLDLAMGKGSHEVSWQPQASPGLYFVKMQIAGSESRIVKLILK